MKDFSDKKAWIDPFRFEACRDVQALQHRRLDEPQDPSAHAGPEFTDQ
jgi:hypothetical protein